MRKVSHWLVRLPSANGMLAASTCILLGIFLTACGTTAGASGAASAAATPTCPPVIPTKTIAGTIQTLTTGAFTVAVSGGTTATVHLSSTTRITRQVQATTAALTTGTGVQITTDSAGVTALRIVVTGNFGSGGRGFGSASGTPFARTPVARGNSSCFRRGTGTGPVQGSSSGSFGGLRGTITSVSSGQLVVSDTQGQSYTVAITASTAIISTTTAKASDLAVGATVVAIGTTTTDGITARTVMIALPVA